MKIIYLHQYFSTYEGANGIRSFCFARKLVERGHNVHMICINDERSKTGLNTKFKNGKRSGFYKGIKITEFDIKYSNHKNFFQRIKVFTLYSIQSTILSLKEDSDIIFASSTPLTVSLAGLVNKFIKGTIFIFEIRDSWPTLPIKMGILKNKFLIKILYFYEKISINFADKCIGLAPGICKEINEIKKTYNSSELITNFCNFENCESKPLNSNLLKDEFHLDIKADDFIAVFTGAHGIANGLDQILDTGKELIKQKQANIKFLFIGDGIRKKQLQERVIKEKIKNCIFLPFLSKNKLAYILKNFANVGLMNLDNIEAFYEGTSPNKFFDYLSFEIPIICNYPGWISKIILENKCGFVVQPNDPESYAKALLELFNDKKLAEEYGNNSLKLAKSHFSLENKSKRLINVLESSFRVHRYKKNKYIKMLIYSMIKECFDRLFALTSLIILFPIMLIIGLFIKFNMGGDIFFTQKRPGYLGKEFTMFKFRTMRNKDKNKDQVDDFSRITKLGKFLRKTSLDELPEILNILKGEMSFVGPRPLLVEYLDLYSEEEHIRHHCKPGITGLAQINGRNKISWEEKFKHDIYYVKNKNLFLDIKILLITFIKVLKKSDVNTKTNNIMPKLSRDNKSL